MGKLATAVKPMCEFCDRISEYVSDQYSSFSLTTRMKFNYYYYVFKI